MQMTMTSIPENLTALGRIVAAEDVITAVPVAGLMAAFGADDPKYTRSLPPLARVVLHGQAAAITPRKRRIGKG